VLTTKDNIEKKLPENLKDLAAVAYNFWHTWSRSAMKLWSKIDPDLWKAYQNPARTSCPCMNWSQKDSTVT